MQKFKYRTPRYSVDLPVRLSLGSTTFSGRCKEISKDGMRLELQQTLAPDCRGTVSLSYQSISLEIPVQVAHSGAHDGLKFLFESDKERMAVARLVALLAARSSQSGPMLVR
jgi:hypothetical protein